MGSRTQPTKVLLDINDWISELKKESSDGKNPINDDSVALHRFQEKLEWILLFGLMEKSAILSSKKTYWNYICACFNSSKRSHEGINFVKSVVPLKSSLGCGRAFIRFCLMQKCLADTLQRCFMNQKISRDFYSERSIIVQEKLWSTLVTSLYELNDLNFDLNPALPELDISWPKYARKLFTSAESLKEVDTFSCDDMCTASLHSFSSQDEHNMTKYVDSESSSNASACGSAKNSELDNVEAFKLIKVNQEISQHNTYLQGKVKSLEEEKLRLEEEIKNFEKQYQSLQEKICYSCEHHVNHVQVCSEGESSSFTTFIGDDKRDGNSAVLKSNEHSNSCTYMCSEDQPSLSMPSVKPKLKENRVTNFSQCALPVSYNESNADSFVLPNQSTGNLQDGNMHYLQKCAYISELFLEFKTVIDDIEDIVQKSDVSLASPHIVRLRKIKTCLEENYLSQIDKSKSFLNFMHFVDSCTSSIKSFTVKQENIISSIQEKVDISIKQNQNLYSRISTLKDLLRSYGFLKVSNENEIDAKNILLPLNANFVAPSKCESFSCDNMSHDPVLKRIFVPLMPVLNSTFAKLGNLNEKIAELQFGLESSQELNNNLITRVKDQELHLKGVSKELEEAQHLVSVLKSQHRKLQSAECILKYDLQEKRKLLNRLKEQLENTREDFNLVRIKNSKSEAEWQDLRNEFVQRHKQTSEESGFIDDRGFEECESTTSNSGCDSSFSEKSETENVSRSNSAAENACEEVPIKKSRLELLEEQCQHLYSNLLQNSKRRQDIDRRLETMCKKIEKSNNRVINSSSPPDELITENSAVNINNASVSTEGFCQNLNLSENFTSSHSASCVGSLNSECSSCVPGLSNDTNLSDSCSEDSFKPDSCISVSPFKLQRNTIQSLSIAEQNDETNTIPDSESMSNYNSDCKADEIGVPFCEAIELSASNVQCEQFQDEALSHVDSILIKKKDLEECLINLEINGEFASDRNRYLNSEEVAKYISELEEEKRMLLNKLQEIEKNNLKITAELDNTTQQLILSKAAKDHEVSALQFQLNTEALKYESALKEFSEQSQGLANMKERVTDQEQLIQALEEALTEIHLDRENAKQQQWQELEEIQIALEAREQECFILCQDLEKSLCEVEKEKNKNETLLSQLEELKACSQRDKESLEAELVHLQKDSMDLKKRLIKLLKEKDLLWKRSNHLYHMQKVKIDDRWMNDSEVSKCLGCKNNFSFMLRKHHCRVCGRIFCYSCSNNWLLTASSSKKIRACNECFMQHIEVKNDVRRGSDVPQIEDDSGDEERNCALSFVPASDSSINSDVPSSITDSVVSLPIIQKHSTPRFASAPDLRYVIKPEDGFPCTISLVDENVEERDEKFLINEEMHKNEGDISSEECTSITLEENIPRINRLKEISVEEIRSLENGLSNKFIMQSGERAELPILCYTCPTVLKWCFTPSCQSISLKITHSTEIPGSEPTIMCEDKHNIQDEMELSLPGYYLFHFDNSLRDTELEVQYKLTVKEISTDIKLL